MLNLIIIFNLLIFLSFYFNNCPICTFVISEAKWKTAIYLRSTVYKSVAMETLKRLFCTIVRFSQFHTNGREVYKSHMSPNTSPTQDTIL